MKEIYKFIGSVFTLFLLAGALEITVFEDKIEADFDTSELCSSNLLRISKDDTNVFKCGYRIVAEWDTVVMHHPTYLAKTTIDKSKTLDYSICARNTTTRCYTKDDFYIQDSRKRTKTELFVISEEPDFAEIQKITYFYKGRTGTDGKLIEHYTFTPDRVKWSYEYISENNNPHKVVLRMKRFEDKYGYEFLPVDPNGYYNGLDEDGYHVYGGVKGDMDIDPQIEGNNTKLKCDYIYKNKTVTETEYKLVNRTKKVPVYKNVTNEYCCNTVGNSTCNVCSTIVCADDCYNSTYRVVDHYDNVTYLYNESYLVNKTMPDKKKTSRIGVIIEGVVYDPRGVNVKKDEKTLVLWNVPIGDRNMDEYGICRPFEMEKGVCQEIIFDKKIKKCD